MIDWLRAWSDALQALEGYMNAVRMQQQTFSMDEFNRLCNNVKNVWAIQHPVE